MEKWIIKENKKEENYNLKLNKFILKILSNREINTVKDIEEFMNPSIDNLITPLLLPNIIKASNLIINSLKDKKSIRIVGDYDVDGVMSTFILYKSLKNLDAIVDYYIPNRVNDGYGINKNIIKTAKDDGIDLIITCDNGIAQYKEIEYANELGIDVIVTDHHEIPINENGEEIIPNAYAVVDPKLSSSKYPFKQICGAVVAFKIIQYIYKIKGYEDETIINEFLQFACIATICDVMPLIRENRIIVKYGLDLLNSTTNIGLLALFKVAGIESKSIDVYHVGFIIGPTINSSGRLKDANIALDLLLEVDENIAYEKASYLRQLNSKRQEMTEIGFNNIDSIINKYNLKKKFPVFVLRDYTIDESIVGIIAGKIKEKYNHPTIILTKTENGLKGSGRSIEDYNMFEKISKHKSLLNKFGGHEMACGLSLDEINFKNFVVEINNNSELTKESLIKKIYIDQEIGLGDISYELIEELDSLKPYGTSNSKATFLTKNLNVLSIAILGKNSNVIKLKLSDGRNEIEGILFEEKDIFFKKLLAFYSEDEIQNMTLSNKNKIFIDIVFNPEINSFRGNSSIQLKISNYRVARENYVK